MWNRIEEKARDLGGLTYDEITEMDCYKLTQNRRVHKGKRLTKNTALERLNTVSAYMSPECKRGFEKCINVINY